MKQFFTILVIASLHSFAQAGGQCLTTYSCLKGTASCTLTTMAGAGIKSFCGERHPGDNYRSCWTVARDGQENIESAICCDKNGNALRIEGEHASVDTSQCF